MAVLGGAGTRWGALAGGVLYAFLDQRPARLGGDLPGPLSEPLFILGTLFILAFHFAPGGLRSRWSALQRAIPPPSMPMRGETSISEISCFPVIRLLHRR
ncbi:hypothetical protein [Actinoplanes sp. NPDC020271]|uniref:hypothetical protein n=1 Tax=Actinoplanes sp. NPDC020271 TaxID=3363896 RepID=UPI0037B9E035